MSDRRVPESSLATDSEAREELERIRRTPASLAHEAATWIDWALEQDSLDGTNGADHGRDLAERLRDYAAMIAPCDAEFARLQERARARAIEAAALEARELQLDRVLRDFGVDIPVVETPARSAATPAGSRGSIAKMEMGIAMRVDALAAMSRRLRRELGRGADCVTPARRSAR